MVSNWKCTVFVAAVLLGFSLLVEISVMTYLMHWAIPRGDFGITWPYQHTATAYLWQYLWNSVGLAFIVYKGCRGDRSGVLFWGVTLDVWAILACLPGDESTRVAVDILVALVTGHDRDSFDYRAHVWVWWTKVALQYLVA